MFIYALGIITGELTWEKNLEKLSKICLKRFTIVSYVEDRFMEKMKMKFGLHITWMKKKFVCWTWLYEFVKEIWNSLRKRILCSRIVQFCKRCCTLYADFEHLIIRKCRKASNRSSYLLSSLSVSHILFISLLRTR